MQTGQIDNDTQTREGHIIKPGDEARQGVTGQNVRYVLGYGTIGVVICFLIVAAFFTWH